MCSWRAGLLLNAVHQRTRLTFSATENTIGHARFLVGKNLAILGLMWQASGVKDTGWFLDPDYRAVEHQIASLHRSELCPEMLAVCCPRSEEFECRKCFPPDRSQELVGSSRHDPNPVLPSHQRRSKGYSFHLPEEATDPRGTARQRFVPRRLEPYQAN